MFKQIAIIASCLLLFSCTEQPAVIEGVWEVENKFYAATYAISQEGNSYKGKVLYYFDGTTTIENSDKPYYVFENLKEQDGVFVDAVSSASQKAQESIAIKPMGMDTLEVIFNLTSNSKRVEYWIRQKENTNESI